MSTAFIYILVLTGRWMHSCPFRRGWSSRSNSRSGGSSGSISRAWAVHPLWCALPGGQKGEHWEYLLYHTRVFSVKKTRQPLGGLLPKEEKNITTTEGFQDLRHYTCWLTDGRFSLARPELCRMLSHTNSASGEFKIRHLECSNPTEGPLVGCG